MVAFRDIAVHSHTDIKIEVLHRVLVYGVKDLKLWSFKLIELA
mgnify:CR=1 FL=1